ncbi:hypothetical protein [Bifidobacterium moraviense]|uniref:hypothetical protein n=1 Tax=Bifidobacterium moraviense TaxID=2675323 RepID=UPI00145E8019|nr:hypothetical protein [Bifidobacterium sp. DSM 109958]
MPSSATITTTPTNNAPGGNSTDAQAGVDASELPLAPSAQLIQQYLDQPRIISAYEKPILERARDNGGVTDDDYEAAWTRFEGCMADRGYTKVTVKRYPNGIVDRGVMRYEPRTIPAYRFGDDADECYRDIAVLNQVYLA